MTPKKIGFIGLGLMGGWMVKHLLASGHTVLGYDTNREKINALLGDGLTPVQELSEMPKMVDVIIFSLPTSKIVSEVVHQGLRLIDNPVKDLVLIDTSTADPRLSKELAEEVSNSGMYFLDAAVSGTSEMCKAKDTLFMVGGSEASYNQWADIFKDMGRESVFMGESGTGSAIKLVVNLVLAINRMGMAEGLTLAKMAGIDQAKALEVLKKSAAYSKSMDQKGSRMVERNFYPPIGHLSTHYKDVQLMVSYAGSLYCPVPAISLAAQALASEMSKGQHDRDSSAIICYYDGLITPSKKY
jgi:2-hydroxy-3-oxopropionate reductase